MIFQHTIDKVLDGTKTQTRRLYKSGDIELVKPLPTDIVFHQRDNLYIYHDVNETREITAVERNGRLCYEIGNDYATQPGRGKVAVARIRLTDIRREDVRNISPADAVAEGFTCRTHFWLTWCKMHDPVFYKRYQTTGQISLAWERGELAQRPAERYDAWALTFELVK